LKPFGFSTAKANAQKKVNHGSHNVATAYHVPTSRMQPNHGHDARRASTPAALDLHGAEVTIRALWSRHTTLICESGAVTDIDRVDCDAAVRDPH
jgi:hypothetical protein